MYIVYVLYMQVSADLLSSIFQDKAFIRSTLGHRSTLGQGPFVSRVAGVGQQSYVWVWVSCHCTFLGPGAVHGHSSSHSQGFLTGWAVLQLLFVCVDGFAPKMVHSDYHGGVASIIQGHDGHEHHCWDERGVSTKKGVQMEWVYVCGVVHSCRLGRWRVYLLDSACTVTPTSPQHDQYSTTRLQPTSSRSPIIIVRLAQDDSLDQLYSLKVKCCCSTRHQGPMPAWHSP